MEQKTMNMFLKKMKKASFIFTLKPKELFGRPSNTYGSCFGFSGGEVGLGVRICQYLSLDLLWCL